MSQGARAARPQAAGFPRIFLTADSADDGFLSANFADFRKGKCGKDNSRPFAKFAD
jgi:hypothetical protein